MINTSALKYFIYIWNQGCTPENIGIVYTLISQSSIYLSIFLSIDVRVCVWLCVFVYVCVYGYVSTHVRVAGRAHLHRVHSWAKGRQRKRSDRRERANKSEKERKSKKWRKQKLSWQRKRFKHTSGSYLSLSFCIFLSLSLSPFLRLHSFWLPLLMLHALSLSLSLALSCSLLLARSSLLRARALCIRIYLCILMYTDVWMHVPNTYIYTDACWRTQCNLWNRRNVATGINDRY